MSCCEAIARCSFTYGNGMLQSVNTIKASIIVLLRFVVCAIEKLSIKTHNGCLNGFIDIYVEKVLRSTYLRDYSLISIFIK